MPPQVATFDHFQSKLHYKIGPACTNSLYPLHILIFFRYFSLKTFDAAFSHLMILLMYFIQAFVSILYLGCQKDV